MPPGPGTITSFFATHHHWRLSRKHRRGGLAGAAKAAGAEDSAEPLRVTPTPRSRTRPAADDLLATACISLRREERLRIPPRPCQSNPFVCQTGFCGPWRAAGCRPSLPRCATGAHSRPARRPCQGRRFFFATSPSLVSRDTITKPARPSAAMMSQARASGLPRARISRLPAG